MFLAGLALCGAVLHLTASRRLRKHLAAVADGLEKKKRVPAFPISHWRAVKRGVRALEDKLASLVESGREGDQFLIGVDACAAEMEIALAVKARFPGCDITIVACEPNRAQNPKISKFLQMAPHARHERWMLTDSEALIDRDFVERFREEWREWDALTAGYRFDGARTMVQAMDVAPALLTLWPGLMLAGKVDFALGACTGVQAEAVREIGGWEALGGCLAEDRELGLRMVAKGRRLGLSRHVLPIEADKMDVAAWLKHQHRVAVTYRLATPAGTLGMPLLHALPLAAAAGFAGGGAWWLVLVIVYQMRLAFAFASARRLKFSIPWLPVVVMVVPMIEFVCWAIAWLPLPVWWSGRWRRLG